MALLEGCPNIGAQEIQKQCSSNKDAYTTMPEVASRQIHEIPTDLRADDGNSEAECPDPLPQPADSRSHECYAQRPEE
jgi:hypothetical protein